jgi:hypothetical protein
LDHNGRELLMRIASLSNGLTLSALMLGALLSVPGTGWARPAYIGIFAANTAQCRARDEFVQVTARELATVDSTCRFRSITAGRGVWHMAARCLTDGTRTNERMTIWATATRMTLHYRSTNFPNLRYHFIRCR